MSISIKKILNSKPMYDALLVSCPSRDENYEISKGGIIVTGKQIRHQLIKCRIDKLGHGQQLPDGSYAPMPLEEGDIVLVEKAVGIFIGNFDEREYRVIRPKHVVMILDPENVEGVE